VREGEALATDAGTFAPCPYCAHTVRFVPLTDDPDDGVEPTAFCRTCGRNLALTWTESEVRVLVV
jgi:hypothetical protein